MIILMINVLYLMCVMLQVPHLYVKYKTLKPGTVPTKFARRAVVKYRSINISRQVNFICYNLIKLRNITIYSVVICTL